MTSHDTKASFSCAAVRLLPVAEANTRPAAANCRANSSPRAPLPAGIKFADEP